MRPDVSPTGLDENCSKKKTLVDFQGLARIFHQGAGEELKGAEIGASLLCAQPGQPHQQYDKRPY